MASGYVGVNPNEAIGAGRVVEQLGGVGGGLRSEFQSASSEAQSAAVVRRLPAAYETYQSLWVDRINKVIHLTEQSGVNVQSGADRGADQQNYSDFAGIGAIASSINRVATAHLPGGG